MVVRMCIWRMALNLVRRVAGRELHVDELGVEAFQIGQHKELLDGMGAHVAVELGIGVAPLFGGPAEEGDIKDVGLGGVGDGGPTWLLIVANSPELKLGL